MRTMILDGVYDLRDCETPLMLVGMTVPDVYDDEVLIKVRACGVCHTEFDEIEGRTAPPSFPVVLGQEVVGHIVQKRKSVKNHVIGERVEVAWIYSACGKCDY